MQVTFQTIRITDVTEGKTSENQKTKQYEKTIHHIPNLPTISINGTERHNKA